VWPFHSPPEPGPPPEPTPSFRIGVKNRAEAPLRCVIELWGTDFVLEPEAEAEVVAFGAEGSVPWINVVHAQDHLTLYLESADRFEIRYRQRE
jgi:hypothetical protein